MIIRFITMIYHILLNVYRNRTERTRTKSVAGKVCNKRTRNKRFTIPKGWYTISENGRRSIQSIGVVCRSSKQRSKGSKSQSQEVSAKELILLALLLFFSMYTVFYHTKGFYFQHEGFG